MKFIFLVYSLLGPIWAKKSYFMIKKNSEGIIQGSIWHGRILRIKVKCQGHIQGHFWPKGILGQSRIAVSSIRARVSQSVIDSLTVKLLNLESLISAPIESWLGMPSTKDSEKLADRFEDGGHMALASLYLSSKIDCPHSPPTMFSADTGSSVCNVPAQLSISVTSFDKASSFLFGCHW